MAGVLERVYGTEEDKVNCPFYIKIGACRYENKCLRIHSVPPISQTILYKHMYQNSAIEVAIATGNQVPQTGIEQALEKFESFYEDVFLKLADFGEIEDLIVCENIGDHLVGNVYIKYTKEEYAEKCMQNLLNMQYEGRPLQMEFSPVIDFSNAKCKQFIEGTCQRGGSCNYMHLKKISSKFKKSLFKQMYEEHPEFREKKQSNSRSRNASKSKKKENKDKDKEKDNNKDKDRERDRDREKEGKKKDKKDKKAKERSLSTSRYNSEERMKMIDDWNQKGGHGKHEEQSNQMFYRQNPELLQLQLQLAALREQLQLLVNQNFQL